MSTKPFKTFHFIVDELHEHIVNAGGNISKSDLKLYLKSNFGAWEGDELKSTKYYSKQEMSDLIEQTLQYSIEKWGLHIITI